MEKHGNHENIFQVTPAEHEKKTEFNNEFDSEIVSTPAVME